MTCIIHTDYVDETKTDEILREVAKVLSEAWYENCKSESNEQAKKKPMQDVW